MNKCGMEFKISPVLGIEIFWQDKMTSCFPVHFHEHFVIGCLLRGERIYKLGNGSGKLETFQLMLINPWQTHQCRSNGKAPASWLGLHLPVQSVLRLAASRNIKTYTPTFHSPLLSDSEAFQDLLELATKPSEQKALALLDHIWAVESQRHSEKINGVRSRLDKPDLVFHKTIKSICAKFIAEPWRSTSLEEMALKANMGKFTFLRKFKKLMGISPCRYLDLLRLNLVRNSLCQGQSLSQCAQYYGYYDQSHMHRCFTANFGYTPGHLQKSIAILSRKGKTKE